MTPEEKKIFDSFSTQKQFAYNAMASDETILDLCVASSMGVASGVMVAMMAIFIIELLREVGLMTEDAINRATGKAIKNMFSQDEEKLKTLKTELDLYGITKKMLVQLPPELLKEVPTFFFEDDVPA